MLFSSVSFLLFFMPCLLLAYFIIPKRLRGMRNLVLLSFSLAFYACGGPKYLALMLLSIAINYACGLLCAPSRGSGTRRAGLVLAVVLNLGLLGWFKYAGFLSGIAQSLYAAFPTVEVLLPIGISFYTFQGMSYVFDVYRADTPVQKNPLKLALYVALFPQLIAGPIVRYTTVADEIDVREESLSDFSGGVQRFMLGFGKKMLLANAAGEIADAVFGMDFRILTTATAWIGALAYTAQIYFDFSAYSDMAIGLGRMFGFHFLENFNYPYIAKSITDFWRRWHISLSTWFRDYVYIPLGGNRCGTLKQIRNILVVWMLTGMWHGAAWNFIVWGLWFGLFLLGEKYLWGKLLAKAGAFVGHIYTLLIVILSWVLFRAPDLSCAVRYAGVMFGAGASGAADGSSYYYLAQYWPEWILFVLASLPIASVLKKLTQRDKPVLSLAGDWGAKAFALLVFVLGYMKLVAGSFNPFIYFRF
ncbi:MAG: MBOAT family protein [Eubacteriales bacterium]